MVSTRLPQQEMGDLSAAIMAGPTAGSDEECGTIEYADPVSMRNCLLVLESVNTRRQPGQTGGSAAMATNAPGLAVSLDLALLRVSTLPGLLPPMVVVEADEGLVVTGLLLAGCC